MFFRRASTVCLGIAIVFTTACGGGSVSDGTGPVVPPVDTTTPPGGTVQRGTITVRVAFDPADVNVASAVGLSTAGFTVRLTRSLSTDPVRTATTGADGSARFENLLEGVIRLMVMGRTLKRTMHLTLPFFSMALVLQIRHAYCIWDTSQIGRAASSTTKRARIRHSLGWG